VFCCVWGGKPDLSDDFCHEGPGILNCPDNHSDSSFVIPTLPVIPAQAGIQWMAIHRLRYDWIPVFTGMTKSCPLTSNFLPYAPCSMLPAASSFFCFCEQE